MIKEACRIQRGPKSFDYSSIGRCQKSKLEPLASMERLRQAARDHLDCILTTSSSYPTCQRQSLQSNQFDIQLSFPPSRLMGHLDLPFKLDPIRWNVVD